MLIVAGKNLRDGVRTLFPIMSIEIYTKFPTISHVICTKTLIIHMQ